MTGRKLATVNSCVFIVVGFRHVAVFLIGYISILFSLASKDPILGANLESNGEGVIDASALRGLSIEGTDGGDKVDKESWSVTSFVALADTG